MYHPLYRSMPHHGKAAIEMDRDAYEGVSESRVYPSVHDLSKQPNSDCIAHSPQKPCKAEIEMRKGVCEQKEKAPNVLAVHGAFECSAYPPLSLNFRFAICGRR